MIYLSGVVRPDLPAMLTPRMRQDPPEGQVWAADNGRYASPHEYSDERYLAWLQKLLPFRERCLFATAPDVWGDAAATQIFSLRMLGPIRDLGYPVAYVAQDGLEAEAVPWDEIDAIFVGGRDAFRHSPALHEIVAEARRRRKWVHMGRVNSLRRMRYAESIGCDSADGTVLKHDGGRPVHEWGPAVLREPSLWRPV